MPAESSSQKPPNFQVFSDPASTIPASSSSSSAAGSSTAKVQKMAPPKVEEYYSSDSSGGSDAEEVKKRGNYAYKVKKYDRAIDRFSRAIKLAEKARNKAGAANAATHPNTASLITYYSNRALSQLGKEKWTEVVSDCETGIAIYDNFQTASSKIGSTTDINEVPPPAKCYFNGAKAYYQLKKFEDSLRVARTGICIWIISHDLLSY